jgi:hypothetical protein
VDQFSATESREETVGEEVADGADETGRYRSGRRRRRWAAALVVLGLAVGAAGWLWAREDGPPWSSGVWTGTSMDADLVHEFEQWRGSSVATVTTYPAYETWAEIAGSQWHVETFQGFDGRLVYGLPLVPDREEGSLTEVGAGDRDGVFAAVAQALVDSGHGDAYVRVGLEANGTWSPWGATAQTAADFRAAFARVVAVMRAEAPDLEFVFDITCGAPLVGAADRMAPLTRLYPGDDVVDVVGCDHYDSYTTRATDEAEWVRASASPPDGPGLEEVADFARQHGKRFAVPEWGLTTTAAEGAGDNPFFIRAMHDFFTRSEDVLEFENYFNEPAPYIQSALWRSDVNPHSAAVYRELWSGG